MSNERIPISERKQLIWMAYFFLRDKNGGLLPTDAEIGALIGYSPKARGTVHTLVNQLVDEGWFKPRGGKFRSLMPLRIQTDTYAELGEIAKGIWEDALQRG